MTLSSCTQTRIAPSTCHSSSGCRRFLLCALVSHADWDALPSCLQDAVDNMLADEALAEGGKPRPFRDLLAEEEG